MIVFVGLGNPDKIYEKTLHNMGYMVVDFFAKKEGLSFTKNKYNASYAEGIVRGKKVILLKPTTYMNLSGDCVWQVVKKLNVDLDKICILYDDIDLDTGAVRFRLNGSAGTHNGMRDIVKKLGTTDFSRVRIGVGRPQNIPLVDYVLSKVSKDKEKCLNESFEKVYDLMIDFIDKDGKLEAKSV